MSVSLSGHIRLSLPSYPAGLANNKFRFNDFTKRFLCCRVINKLQETRARELSLFFPRLMDCREMRPEVFSQLNIIIANHRNVRRNPYPQI